MKDTSIIVGCFYCMVISKFKVLLLHAIFCALNLVAYLISTGKLKRLSICWIRMFSLYNLPNSFSPKAKLFPPHSDPQKWTQYYVTYYLGFMIWTNLNLPHIRKQMIKFRCFKLFVPEEMLNSPFTSLFIPSLFFIIPSLKRTCLFI